MLLVLSCCLGSCRTCWEDSPSRDPIGPAEAQPDPPPAPLRILTINAWSGLTYEGVFTIDRCPDDDPEARYRLLVEGIRELAPDIVAVQEANPLPERAARLADELGYEEIHRLCLGGIRVGPIGLPTNLREGQVLLVRRPWTVEDLGSETLEGWGLATEPLSFHFGEITRVLRARVVVRGRPLLVFAVHLRSGPFAGPALDEARRSVEPDFPRAEIEEALGSVRADAERREREIARLLDAIRCASPPGAPAVLLGDFNTTADSGELAPLDGDAGWADSFAVVHPGASGATWDPGGNPNFRPAHRACTADERLRDRHERAPARIDFVFVRGIESSRILDSRVVLTPRDGACPSDHYGVLTILDW